MPMKVPISSPCSRSATMRWLVRCPFAVQFLRQLADALAGPPQRRFRVGPGSRLQHYTIAAASIPAPELPPEVTKRLPRYAALPAVRMGRLAVDVAFRRRGLGGALLADALRRVLLAPPAVFALLVDAKDDEAVAFYQHHGFQSFHMLLGIDAPSSFAIAAAIVLPWNRPFSMKISLVCTPATITPAR